MISATGEPWQHAVQQQVTVIFDWNGTLADDVAQAVAATNAVLERFQRPALSEAAFRSTFILPLESFFRALDLPAEAVGDAVTQWNGGMRTGAVRLMDGAAETVHTLGRDGALLGVVSAAGWSAISPGVQQLEREAGRGLDFLRSSVMDKARVIASLVRDVGGPVLYVGDTEYDIVSAQRGGARAVGLARGYRPRAALEKVGPEWLVDDLREIPAIAREATPKLEVAT